MCNLYNVTTNQQAIRDFISISRLLQVAGVVALLVAIGVAVLLGTSARV